MKASAIVLGTLLLNAFTGGLLLKGLGKLAGLILSATGLSGALGAAGTAATGMGTAATAAATTAGTTAATATTAATNAATLAARATLLSNGTMAAQLAVFAASAYATYKAIDYVLGDWLERRNDAATGDYVDRVVRPAMDASMDKHGDKLASAAAVERKKKGEALSDGYDLSGYQGVGDVRSHQFDRPTAAGADAISAYESRQSRFDLSNVDSAIDAKVDAAVKTIDARNAEIVTNLQPITVVTDRGAVTGYFPAGTTSDDIIRDNRLKTSGR